MKFKIVPIKGDAFILSDILDISVWVKDLSKIFTKVCKKLCEENKGILETLANIEPKNNES